MWNLDDTTYYSLFSRFELDRVLTFGANDAAKREVVRHAAAARWPHHLRHFDAWAFRITAHRQKDFDVDNVPKIIIDAFCKERIERDGSNYPAVALYPTDTMDHVRLVQVSGSKTTEQRTLIEIFGCKSRGSAV